VTPNTPLTNVAFAMPGALVTFVAFVALAGHDAMQSLVEFPEALDGTRKTVSPSKKPYELSASNVAAPARVSPVCEPYTTVDATATVVALSSRLIVYHRPSRAAK
jgi:hypothetical protein